MGNEHLHEKPEPKQESVEGQKNAVDDLRFIRSAVEKTYRQVKPKTSNSVMWGLICMAIYVGIHCYEAILVKW